MARTSGIAGVHGNSYAWSRLRRLHESDAEEAASSRTPALAVYMSTIAMATQRRLYGTSDEGKMLTQAYASCHQHDCLIRSVKKHRKRLDAAAACCSCPSSPSILLLLDELLKTAADRQTSPSTSRMPRLISSRGKLRKLRRRSAGCSPGPFYISHRSACCGCLRFTGSCVRLIACSFDLSSLSNS